MFNKKTDPLASSVQKVMQENALRRELEQKLNEELGIASKKALPHELHADYDDVLAENIEVVINEISSSKLDQAAKKSFEKLRALHQDAEKYDGGKEGIKLHAKELDRQTILFTNAAQKKRKKESFDRVFNNSGMSAAKKRRLGIKEDVPEVTRRNTEDHGITHEPPKETGARGKKPGLDTKGLAKMLDTPPENGGIKDSIKESKKTIFKKALAKMKGSDEVVDASDDDGAHIKAQSELHVNSDPKKMRKEETLTDRVRIVLESGMIPLARRVVNKPSFNIGGKWAQGKTPANILPRPPLPTPQTGIPEFGQNRPTSPGAHPDRASVEAPAVGSSPVSPTPAPDSRVGKFSPQGALRPAIPTEPGPRGPAKAIQNALGTSQQDQVSNALKPGAPVPSSVAAPRPKTPLTPITQHAGMTAPKPPEVGSAPGEGAHETAGPATVVKNTVPVPGPSATPTVPAAPGAARRQSAAAAAVRAPAPEKTQDASGPGRSWQDKAIHKIDTGN